MHRDYIGHEGEGHRGSCSKQFLADLRDQGVGRDEAIEAVSRRFGVSRSAASLFVLAHPAWAEEDAHPSWPWWGAARG